ncbi:Gfo/Idh/MocA family protein [Chelatococcus sp. GCM10030263]|uniref:Gfo/Idh/MocA family protein n=1 Tax=Chelatococcus sp. GCM10030263 TaxID=3273387 RepID=UPI0036165006
MRVAFIGVSHWHIGLYLDPFLDLIRAGELDAELVGMADPDPAVVDGFKARLGCDGDTDYRALCERTKPDFVFALGRHCDMAEEAAYLIEAGIPFAIEKPCGLNGAEVERLADLAERKGSFAAVPLVLRNGGFLATVDPMVAREGVHYATFRFVAGSAKRYLDNGCAWMLDPKLSGGGCTVNLAVHFFDICQMWFGGPDLKVVSSTMSNAAWGFPVEDYSAVTLASGSKTCVIESGYLYPAPTNVFDMHYAVKTGSHYVTAWGPKALEIRDYDGKGEMLDVSNTNVPHYRDFVIDVLARSAAGRPPLASLRDMARAFRLIDEAYRLAQPLAVARAG